MWRSVTILLVATALLVPFLGQASKSKKADHSTATTAVAKTTKPSDVLIGQHGIAITTCGGPFAEVTVQSGDVLEEIVKLYVNLKASSDVGQDADLNMSEELIAENNHLEKLPTKKFKGWKIFPGQKLKLPTYCSDHVGD